MGKKFEGDIVTGYHSNKITPSATEFDPVRGLWIGTAGTINVTFPNGVEADAMPAIAGLFPFQVIAVRTGGTAADIWTVY